MFLITDPDLLALSLIWETKNVFNGMQSRRGGNAGQLESGGLDILAVESHSRLEQDWYAATVALDVVAFLYVVIFYQARTLPRLLFA